MSQAPLAKSRRPAIFGILFVAALIASAPASGAEACPTSASEISTPIRVEFHLGFRLNSSSPDHFFGIGYSFRFDGLF